MRLGSLFTGYGGLCHLAAAPFFDADTVWCSDIDSGARKILAHRMPDIPNLGDITTVDWTTVEPVDILTGGWPCQPFSLAGKRKGAADERALWPFVAGAVRALRPRYVVLENVAAIATAGELARACADLAAFGYVGSWRCLRAADVGAPHGRARIFIVAHPSQQRRRPERRDDGVRPERLVAVDAPTDSASINAPRAIGSGDRSGRPVRAYRDSSDAPADPASNGRHQGWPERARLIGGPDATQRSHAATDTDSQRHGGRQDGRLVGRLDSGEEGTAREWERSRQESGDRGAEVATDTDSRGRARLGRQLTVRRDPDRRSGADGPWPQDQREALVQVDEFDGASSLSPTATAAMRDLRADVPSTVGETTDVLAGMQGDPTQPTDNRALCGCGAWGRYGAAIHRWELILRRPAPAPTELSPRGSRRLSPSAVEFMMGLPESWVCDVPGLTRNEQLKALGNGVVPQQALAALGLLTVECAA